MPRDPGIELRRMTKGITARRGRVRPELDSGSQGGVGPLSNPPLQVHLFPNQISIKASFGLYGLLRDDVDDWPGVIASANNGIAKIGVLTVSAFL